MERRELGRKPTTLATTTYRLEALLAPVLQLAPARLTADRAAALYQELRGKAAADTHRNILAETKTFLRWCVAQRWIRRSPLEEVAGIGKRRHGKPQLRIDEARRWRTVAHERARAGELGAVGALMALTMGLRASEITGRVVRDLDDDGRLLWIDDAKTEAGRRTVAVPEELRGYLAELSRGKPGDALIFGKHWRDWPRENVQRLCKLAKVPKVTAHGMRGLAATLAGAAAVLSGSGLDAIAASLGHADASVTETSYADRGALEKARRRRALTVLDGGQSVR